ncbi:MAG: 50S ribosomal protein L9 [Actinomycetota bacterium]
MSSIKVILRADVDGLGKRGDVVSVSKGYARNFLEPRHLALPASDGSLRQAESMRRVRSIKDANDRAAAEEVARRLVAATITIPVRAGEGGRLFGSVTVADVSSAVAEQQGIEIDRRLLVLDEPIQDLGTFMVPAKLHADVEFPITVEVVAN